MSRIAWLVFAAALFTVIPWVIASTFWGIGDPPPRAQFAPRQDAVVVSVALEQTNAGRGWHAPDVHVRLDGSGPGETVRLSGITFGNTSLRRAEAEIADLQAGQSLRVFEHAGAWYPARFRIMDLAVWFVSLFCAFVGLAGLAGIGFTILGGGR